MAEKGFLQGKSAGIFYTLCGGICWGLSGCFGQYLFREKGVTADWLVALRLVFAGVLLSLLGLRSQKKEMRIILRDSKDRLWLVVFGLVGMLVTQLTYFLAIQHSNAGTATVLQSLSSIMILVVVCVREWRLPRRLEGGAIFCAILGVFLLSTHGNIHSMTLTGKALAYGLISAVGVVVYNMLSGRLLQKYGVYPVVGYGMLLGGIVLVLCVRPWNYAVVWDGETLLAFCGVAILGTAVAFSLYLKGVSIVGPLIGSILGMVEPITAVLISLVFLDEAFVWMDMVGFALILGTVCVLSLRTRR